MTEQARKVIKIITPQSVLDGAGVAIQRSIATRTLNYLDPFLLFDHFGSDDPDEYIAGFPMHPHRGIETVTYMLAGLVRHRDSLDNSGVIGPGDVQWMTAGGGVMHEEMPEMSRGTLFGFQLWVNLPAKLKLSPSRYQEIPAASIPEVKREGGGTVRVVAGAVDGVSGPVADIAADPTYLDVILTPHGSFRQPVERGHTAFAYLYAGRGAFGDGDAETISSPRLLVLGDGDYVQARTQAQPARFLLVSGQPLGEPIARHGPFVMNTREEILQALRDLRNGTFVAQSG